MLTQDDHLALAQCMLNLLAQRGTNLTACPSEIARFWSPDTWRLQMENVRLVAAELSQNGQIDILQKGLVVMPGQPWTGPIRLRIRRQNG